MRNKYFILRHGQTIHQTKKKGIIYGWPDDNPPCGLTKYGRCQIKKIAKSLKKKKINLIFSSDTLRTRQTAGIIAKQLNLKINHDKRLRDINCGIYQGKSVLRAWTYYKNPKLKFKKAPPKGESWLDCQNRMIDFLKEIDNKYRGKNILIVSHGDPLWLLEGWIRQWSQDQLLEQKLIRRTIKVGELRKF